MEGITEPCFRDLVLARNPPDALGGTFTEFVRVVEHPMPAHALRRHLGEPRSVQPVGLQLMGAHVDALAETARRAIEVGARLVDLNFGCPAKGALRGCAGSALLREPRKVEALVRACVSALGEHPLTAKIRAGYDDDRLLVDLARAVEAGGAALLTVHCRTRAEAYCEHADWSRIARAVAAVSIPVCGNGGVGAHADFERMRSETGCAFAMVGRGALADPWIFSGRSVGTAEAARFLVEYAEALQVRGGAGIAGAAARVKQLLHFWTAGELVGDERHAWLREREPERLLGRLAEFAGGAASRVSSRNAPESSARGDRTS
jgi:tRNA-dihydrouridine synthase